MDSMKKKTPLYERPWLAMLAVILASLFSMNLTGFVTYGLLGFPDNEPMVRFIQQVSFHILTGFIIAPFILRLPQGKTSFRKYLDDIGLTRLKPFFRLVLLGLSCALILALAQAAASIVYRVFEGNPVSGRFLRQVFNFSKLNPSKSPDILLALPSIFEEVGFRGIVLTVFLGKYKDRRAIIFSSIGFAMIHLVNLGSGKELIFVLGQLVWSFILGLFYGYVFIQTRSLLPSMIVHFISNALVNLLSGYMITRGGVEIQVVYQIIFSFGILPTILMILWTSFYKDKWLPKTAMEAN